MTETLKILEKRKSVRAFTDQPVSENDKQAILHAAMRAPTAGNMMLYSILDITDQTIKDRLSETCDHQNFIAKAPMVLVFCADYRRWMRKFATVGCDGGNIVKPMEGNLMLAACDTLIAAQNAVIAAESLGLGSCYIGDVLENFEIHKKLLCLPQYVVPICMLVLGYPTETQLERPNRERFPLDMIVFENKYRDLNENEIERFANNLNIDAFYHRKHASEFMVEMNRSVRAILDCWCQQ